MALVIGLSAVSIWWYGRNGRRMLDKGSPLRASVRLFAALYYAALAIHPDYFSEELQRAAGRNFFLSIMAVDIAWFQVERVVKWWVRYDPIGRLRRRQ